MATFKDVDDSFIKAYHTKFNLLIVTATEIEKKVLHEHLKPLPGEASILRIQHEKHTYFVGIFGVFHAVHIACDEIGSIGRSSSAMTTAAAISSWSPTVVLMVGIAFGAKKGEQKIGDVLVAERIVAYDPQKIDDKKGIIDRGKEGPASSLLLNRFRSVENWDYLIGTRKPQVFTGLVLSGEKLINDPIFKAELFRIWPEAIGGEMEGAGVYAACDQHVNDWILVKSICDFADGNKGKRKSYNQKVAINSSVKLCEVVFSAPLAFKKVNLTVNNEILNTDPGAIPDWLTDKVKAISKEIRHEN